jgi:hypothetical protein
VVLRLRIRRGLTLEDTSWFALKNDLILTKFARDSRSRKYMAGLALFLSYSPSYSPDPTALLPPHVTNAALAGWPC